MEIRIKRKHFKAEYTIGVLSIDEAKFKCDTLELAPQPPKGEHLDSNANGEDSIEHEKSKVKNESGEVEQSRTLVTNKFPLGGLGGCIPPGKYSVKLGMSQKFKGWRPYVMAVPGRSGIIIHEGNSVADTRGCILVGENRQRGKVLNSRNTLRRLMDIIYRAEECREPVKLVIE